MSDIVGPEDPTRLMWEMSLGEFLDTVARRNPDKVFVEMEGEEVTYGRFRETARRAASMFQGLGVSSGDRVCLFLPNCLEFLYCWFGLSYLGARGLKVTMSDIVGPEDPTRLMWEMSLGEFLDTVARRNPDKVFVEMEGEEVTYGRFRETITPYR